MSRAIKNYVDTRDEATEARVSAYARESRAQIEASDRIFQATHQEMLRVNRSIERRMDHIEQAMIAMKRTVIITGITATLSTVFGVAAFNAALLSNMQASFDSGRGHGAAQAEVAQQVRQLNTRTREADRQLREIIEQQSQKNGAAGAGNRCSPDKNRNDPRGDGGQPAPRQQEKIAGPAVLAPPYEFPGRL